MGVKQRETDFLGLLNRCENESAAVDDTLAAFGRLAGTNPTGDLRLMALLYHIGSDASISHALRILGGVAEAADAERRIRCVIAEEAPGSRLISAKQAVAFAR